jgi:hypothetical protein
LPIQVLLLRNVLNQAARNCDNSVCQAHDRDETPPQ